MSNDHVTIPRTSLLQFSISGKVFYLDLKSNEILSAFAKTYNTKPNYYPSNKEKFLSSEIETTIGRLRKMLYEFTEKKTEIVLPNSIKDDVIRCLAIQRLRMPGFVSHIRSRSIFARPFNIPNELFSPLHHNDNKLIDMAINIFRNNFMDYDINICIIGINSEFSYILPTTHCLSSDKYVLFVLSPYHALILLPKEDNAKNYDEDGVLRYIRITDYIDIEPIYMKAVKDEMNNRDGRIIGLKPQLERLQKKITVELL